MWIDEVDVACAGNLEQVSIFFSVAFAPLFGGDIVAAERRWYGVVGRAVNEPLARVRDREFHRVGFAVVLRYLCGRAVKKLDDRIIAEVKLVSALQVDNTGKREDASNARFVSGEAERKLSAGGMAHHHDSF